MTFLSRKVGLKDTDLSVTSETGSVVFYVKRDTEFMYMCFLTVNHLYSKVEICLVNVLNDSSIIPMSEVVCGHDPAVILAD